MGRKLAGLVGTITALLAFGLTVTSATAHTPAPSPAHHTLAEGKGPTSVTA